MQKVLSKLKEIGSDLWERKILTLSLLVVYVASYFLQSLLFVNSGVLAEEQKENIHLVAVVVDDRIYSDLEDEIQWYATEYIQQKLDNSKAIVLSLNVDESNSESLKALDIVKILENMYFEGVKDQSSSLDGLVLVGDIPLPVVETDGFVYPSIYPFVDFEEQQFVYEENVGYFVYQKNMDAQAEVWHGIINFDNIDDYKKYFSDEKLKKYADDPEWFVGKQIWYDDFVALKKYFTTDSMQAYMNNFIFTDDVANRRYTNSMVDLVKGNYTDMVNGVLSSLQDNQDAMNLEDGSDFAENYSNYADNMAEMSDQLAEFNTNTQIPTLSLRSVLSEFFKGYDVLLGTNYLSTMRDNVEASARWYDFNENGGVSYAMDSHFDKIEMKDSWLKYDFDQKTLPFISDLNNKLEDAVDYQIEQEEYFMKIPVATQYKKTVKDIGSSSLIKRWKWCETLVDDRYTNYYFGRKAVAVSSAEQFSIYRGSYRNLDYEDFGEVELSEIQDSNYPLSTADNDLKYQSVGASFGIFATQIEANRGYNLDSMIEEGEIYSGNKIHINTTTEGCRDWYLPFPHWDIVCRAWAYEVDEDSDFEGTGDFAIRNRGGASQVNLDQELLQQNIFEFNSYDYEWAWKDLYDMAGAKRIDSPEFEANSYLGYSEYASLILDHDVMGYQFYPKYLDGELQDEGKITLDYDEVDYFSVYNNEANRGAAGNSYYKEISILGGDKGSALSVWNGDFLGSACSSDFGESNIYKYKLVDSRVKNGSFNKAQLEGEQLGDYEEGGVVYENYNEILTSVSSITDLIDTMKAGFQGDNGPVKGMQDIILMTNSIEGNVETILNEPFSATTSDATVNDWVNFVQSIVTDTKIDRYHNKASEVNGGLLQVYTNINMLSLDEANILLDRLDFQTVLLDEWVANLVIAVDDVQVKFLELEDNYSPNTRNVFNQMLSFQDFDDAISSKIDELDSLIMSGDIQLGCTRGYKYKYLCNALYNLKAMDLPNLENEIDDGNDNTTGDVASQITEFYEDPDDDPVNVFDKIEDSFEEIKKNHILKTEYKLFDYIEDFLERLGELETISADEIVDQRDPMSIMTSDRPIDSPRFISFQGVGGDLVEFVYPNLYQVEVFEEEDGKLYLKSRAEIEDAIRLYLRQVVEDYNTKLQEQLNLRNSFMNQNGEDAFDLLYEADDLASPDRSYDYFDEDYFIEILGGDSIIEIVAELLYYQNLPWSTRTEDDNVMQNIDLMRNSFDINPKISFVVSNYLKADNYSGDIISPGYEENGYEVAYINSDGKDLIDYSDLPDLVVNIADYSVDFDLYQQSIMDQVGSYANGEIALGEDIDEECNIDPSGVVPFQEFPAAFMCWLEKTIEKPISVSISFPDAMGPIIGGEGLFGTGFFDSYLGEIEDATEEELQEYVEDLQDYQEMVDALNVENQNQEIISTVAPEIGTSLQEVLSYSVPEVLIDDSSVDSFSGSISIMSSRDLGAVQVGIYVVGDNCLAIANMSTDLCENPVDVQTNYYDESLVLNLDLEQKIAGESVVVFEFCLPEYPQQCVQKSQKINLIPSDLDTIEISSVDDFLVKGAIMNVFVDAYDEYGNELGQMIDEYEITVDNGFLINSAGNQSKSFRFTSFNDLRYRFVAPNSPGFAHIKVFDVRAGEQYEDFVLSIVEGNLSLSYAGENVDNGEEISYALPDDLTDINYKDDNDLQQVNDENLPQIVFNFQTNDGLPLDTNIRVVTENNLLEAGYIETRQVQMNNGDYEIQKNFRSKQDFKVMNGELTVYFYPKFEAGQDVISISVPGFDEIRIPVNVEAAAPRLINLTVEKELLRVGETTNASVEIRDIWENIVTRPTELRVGSIGNIKVDGENIKNIVVEGGRQDEILIESFDPGGRAFLYAMVDTGILSMSEQMPGYQEILVQKTMVPEENLNVMYLNLFGWDWGNQWGYFSENDKFVNTVMQESDKLLAVTTQLVDPNYLQKFAVIIDENARINNLASEEISFTIKEGNFDFVVGSVAEVLFEQDFELYEWNLEDGNNEQDYIDQIAESIFVDNESSILYFPEDTDSVITGNTVEGKSIFINGQKVLDLEDGFIDGDLKIVLSNKKYFGYNLWVLELDEKEIGKFIVWTEVDSLPLLSDTGNSRSTNYGEINLKTMDYDAVKTFADASTNGVDGIGIVEKNANFPKTVSYDSIEASLDPEKNIGFRGDFKNISLFADGDSVGEATLGFASHFLINFGDPLLTRIDENELLADTDFDGGIGDSIINEPGKTIFNVMHTDFNNDELEDLIVAYTDGTLKIWKNYGGETDPFQSMGNLMVIVGGIKDIMVGDVDGNLYPDILVWTNNNQLRAYTNRKGIFDVDGKMVCLNTNVVTGEISDNPESLDGVYQVFFEYMDEELDDPDGTLDIVTNDQRGDVKIFYGGETNGRANYLSELSYACDAGRYDAQEDSTKLVKSFGAEIQEDTVIQDYSLVSWLGLQKPEQNEIDASEIIDALGGAGDLDIEIDEEDFNLAEFFEQLLSMFGDRLDGLNDVNISALTNEYSEDLFRFVDFPLDWGGQTGYAIPMAYLNSGDKLVVYKLYDDLNGGILQNGDVVKVTVHLESLGDVNSIKFIDQLFGPWKYKEDEGGAISGFNIVKNDGNDNVIFNRNLDIGNAYLYNFENLFLDEGDEFVYEYLLEYVPGQIIEVDIEDRLVSNKICVSECFEDDVLKMKDNLNDIIVKPLNACMKAMWIFANSDNPSENYRQYDEYFIDLAKRLADYQNSLQAQQEAVMEQFNQDILNMMSSGMNGEGFEIPGDVFEMDWDSVGLLEGLSLTGLVDNGWELLQGGEIDLGNITLDIMGGKMADLEEKLQGILEGMCQGFKLQPDNPCQGLPVPFNVDLLSPGNFNIMGCPIQPAFPGLPIFHYPGTVYVPPIGPVPLPWGLKVPNPVDNFIWVPGGVYPSMVRVYVSPTLTMQLGVAVCIGPSSLQLPPLIGDLGGNCIVTAIPLPCGAGDDVYSSDQVVNNELLDAASMGTCSKPTHPSVNRSEPSGGFVGYNSANPEPGSYRLDEVNIAGTPFQLVSAGDNTAYPTPAIPADAYVGGMIEFDTVPVIDDDLSGDLEFIELKAGPEIYNKIVGGLSPKGLAKCVVQDWLDKQIKYILNNMTKMTIAVTFPDLTDLTQGFEKIAVEEDQRMSNAQDYCDTNSEYFACVMQQYLKSWSEEYVEPELLADQQAGYISDIQRGVDAGPNADIFEQASIIAQNNWIQEQNLYNLSQHMANPFDVLETMFKDVKLVSLNSQEVSVKIPMIYAEDIGKYSDYLSTWLEVNQRVMGQWEDLFIATVGWCAKEESSLDFSTKNLSEGMEDLEADFDDAKTNLANQPALIQTKKDLENIKSDEQQTIEYAIDIIDQQMSELMDSVAGVVLDAYSTELFNDELSALQEQKDNMDYELAVEVVDKEIQRIDRQLNKNEKCLKFTQNKSLSNFIEFQENSQLLIESIRKNIEVLEEYKKLPFELYEWIHVQDRYLSEVSAILSNFVGTISMWMEANAERFAGYVDAFILMMDAVKTWQVLIDLSANWSAKCGKCSVDTYDQYSCKLSMICPDILSVAPIPPFKIPSIFIDLSHIDVGMDILLPKLNFTPIHINLPEFPNLPSPPSYNFDVDIGNQMEFGVDMIADIDIDFGEISMPTIPILPEPPEFPELPSFLPSVEMELPVLPPAPEIPRLTPEIEGMVSVAERVGKIFCILKGGIGLVAENQIKSKIEQLTQRSYNVPIFDDFDLTFQQKETPLKGFDYQIDSFVSIHYNFDKALEVIEGIANTVNQVTTNVGNVTQSKIDSSTDWIYSGSDLLDDKFNDWIDEQEEKVKDWQVFDKIQNILDYEDKLRDWTQEQIQQLELLPQDQIDEMKGRTKDQFDQYKEDLFGYYGDSQKIEYYASYQEAYEDLFKGLSFLQNKVDGDAKYEQEVDYLLTMLEADNGVVTNQAGLQDLEKQVNYIIDKKRAEINDLADKVKNNYDEFLDEIDKNSVSLVSNTMEEVHFATNLFDAEENTKLLLAQQEHPMKTRLDINSQEVNGYLNAMENNSAAQLNMTDIDYQNTKLYLEDVDKTIDGALPLFADQDLEKIAFVDGQDVLLSQNTCQSCSEDADQGGDNSPYASDLSSFVKGIFVKNDEGMNVNVVNSDEFVGQIRDYEVVDMNKDGMDDVLLWMDNEVFVKYAQNEKDYGGVVSVADDRYYLVEIDSIEDLEDLLDDDGYFSFTRVDLDLKLWDYNFEVKDFSMIGQTFDSISFAWANSIKMGDAPDAYLLKLNHRVDTFYDKDVEYFSNDSVRKQKKYILMLPKGTQNYSGRYIDLEGEWGTIDSFFSGTISDIKFYDPYKEKISLTLTEIPRAWQYAKIAVLNKTDFNRGDMYEISSPWSNQILGGRQIIADNVGPKPVVSLERITTEEILSTGAVHEGFVGTHYNLGALWTDNLVVRKMGIKYDGVDILTGESLLSTGQIVLEDLFFTGEDNLKFLFWAEDVNKNYEEQIVSLDIIVPEISITDIVVPSEGTREIVVEISQDIDEGAVVFEKQNDAVWKYISGTNDSAYGGYMIGVGDTVVTGGVYDFGYEIGIYDMDGVLVGDLDANYGELQIYEEFQDDIVLRMNYSSHLPEIVVFDLRYNKTLFTISLPAEELSSVQMYQGDQNYNLVDMGNILSLGDFRNGQAIVAADGEVVCYLSDEGKIYVPSPFNARLQGEYFFDAVNKRVEYLIQDDAGVDIATVVVKVDPFLNGG